MSQWSRRVWGWMVASIVWASVVPVQAQDVLPKAGTWSSGIRAGYTFSLDNKGVEMIPIHLHIGYTLFKGKPWLLPEGSFEIGVEPFASVITSLKRDNAKGSNEFGLVLPVLSYYFNLGGGFAPYVVGGLGVMYKDLRGYHLGGKFTFMETAGVGLSYFLNENITMSAEWRYRHMSNASIYKENSGLNSGIILAGISYYLPN
jgi:hypothetical protein